MTKIDKIIVGKLSLKSKVIRAIWYIVYVVMFRPCGTKLFNPWRLVLLRMFGAKVKSSSGVYASVKIWAPWNLILGNNAWLGPNVICYNQAMVVLQDNVTVSQYTYLCTAGHDSSKINSHNNSLIVAPILIENNAWIGANAFVGMGVSIGEGAIVGASAAVFKNVEPWTIVGGNPAKFIKKRQLTMDNS
jgi:putative colanic acid biosynthesis acetyltransferase WcaF